MFSKSMFSQMLFPSGIWGTLMYQVDAQYNASSLLFLYDVFDRDSLACPSPRPFPTMQSNNDPVKSRALGIIRYQISLLRIADFNRSVQCNSSCRCWCIKWGVWHLVLSLQLAQLFWSIISSQHNITRVAWPSGLRRWFKAPVSSEAWVRIPPLPNNFSHCLWAYST